MKSMRIFLTGEKERHEFLRMRFTHMQAITFGGSKYLALLDGATPALARIGN